MGFTYWVNYFEEFEGQRRETTCKIHVPRNDALTADDLHQWAKSTWSQPKRVPLKFLRERCPGLPHDWLKSAKPDDLAPMPRLQMSENVFLDSALAIGVLKSIPPHSPSDDDHKKLSPVDRMRAQIRKNPNGRTLKRNSLIKAATINRQRGLAALDVLKKMGEYDG